MKKRLLSVIACLTLCLLLLPLTAQRAEATVYDHIRNYEVKVSANAEDGSLSITNTFEWEAVEELPYGQELKIGIPNGSIRDVTPLTDNIENLEFDNSYMYVYLKSGYKAGEVFNFSFSWVQEYMYTLGDDGSVNYEYTPGWFDEISIDRMQLSWFNPEGVTAQSVVADHTDGEWVKEGKSLVGTDLPYGAQVTLTAVYTDWPNELFFENSAGNLPPEYEGGGGGDWDYDSDDGDALLGFIVLVIIIAVVIWIKTADDGYSGGFGTRYVFVDGLWYPSASNGKPKPGSVGTKTKPSPPRSHSSGGGFGGGSRGGGFGGGGFGGGGGHCACASSCACACACACAGGGRAGCSTKNLYGAVHLNDELTQELNQ